MTSDRIVIDPGIMLGKPVIKGTRLTVELIVGLLANGWSHDDLFRSYPGLTEDDILACLQFAHELLEEQKYYPARRN